MRRRSKTRLALPEHRVLRRKKPSRECRHVDPRFLRAAPCRAPATRAAAPAAAELPGDADAAETASFQRGEGGALAPVVCVDKLPGEIDSFAALLDESQRTGVEWDILFVASLPGRAGLAPNPDEAVQPLRMMVEAIKDGRIDGFIAVTRDGRLVREVHPQARFATGQPQLAHAHRGEATQQARDLLARQPARGCGACLVTIGRQ